MSHDMCALPRVPAKLWRANAFGAFSFTGPKPKINRGSTDTMEMEIEMEIADRDGINGN